MAAPGNPPRAVVLVVEGPVCRGDIGGICARARQVLSDTESERLVCDVSGLIEVDAVIVDALARVHLTARRLGRELELRGANVELVALMAWMGVDRALRHGH